MLILVKIAMKKGLTRNGVTYMGKLTSRVEKLYRIFSKAAGLFAGLRAVLYFIGRRKRKYFLEAVRQSDRFFCKQ